jgi:predicted phosphodiesterase
MKKIAILSDTHAYWDERYIPYLEVCDEIWHAGDIGSAVLAQQLDTIGPLRAVHGNCDGYPLRYNYGPHLLFELEQGKVLITHIGGYPGHYDSTALDLIKKHKPIYANVPTARVQSPSNRRGSFSLLVKNVSHILTAT